MELFTFVNNIIMIGYTSLGTNDMEKATAFYDALLGELGAKKFLDMGRFVLWMPEWWAGGIALAEPHNGGAATAWNGNMIAIAADSPKKVDAMYAKALELWGTDEGKPGERMPGFYAGYFRDLDGNKLNFFHLAS